MTKRAFIVIPATVLAFSGLALAGVGAGSGVAHALPCSNDMTDIDYYICARGGGGGGHSPFGTGPGQVDLLPGVTQNGPISLTNPGQTDLTQGSNGSNTCINGYVWRNARDGDGVCVTPATRDQIAAENADPDAHRDPNGAYGPQSCAQGWVWRQAFDGDTVCVTPDIRTNTLADNAAAQSRKAG